MTRLAVIAGLTLSLVIAAATGTVSATDVPAGRPLVNERCPVTIEEFATPSHEIHWADYSVRFCCEKCQRRFEADPATYVTNLPQLPPELVEQTILDSRGGARNARAASRIEQWTQPVLLAIVGVIGLWLVARVARRRSGRPPTVES
jgi:hypothetical protein